MGRVYYGLHMTDFCRECETERSMNDMEKHFQHHDIENADIYEMLNQGGKLIYDAEEGTAVSLGGVMLSNISDTGVLGGLLERTGNTGIDLYCVHSENAAEFIKDKCGMHGMNHCSQWVYTGDMIKTDAECIIRADIGDLQLIAAHSDEDVKYLAERIAAGCMWEIREEGRLAGFIGMHEAGSIGMLQVLPEFRRKGIGARLLSFAVQRQLDRGSIPYMHVVDGNAASTALQRSIGAVKCTAPALWVY